MKKSLTNNPNFWNYIYNTSLSKAEEFLKKGQDPNSKQEEGFTALHLTSSSGEDKIVKLLLKYGADVNSLDKGDRTPLHHASIEFRKDIVEILLKNKANPNLKDGRGIAPIHYILTMPARFNNDPHLVSRLNIKNIEEAEDLIINILKLFVKYNSDINLQDNPNMATALHLAASANNKKVVNFLIKNKANKNIKDKLGNIPRDLTTDNSIRDIL